MFCSLYICFSSALAWETVLYLSLQILVTECSRVISSGHPWNPSSLPPLWLHSLSSPAQCGSLAVLSLNLCRCCPLHLNTACPANPLPALPLPIPMLLKCHPPWTSLTVIDTPVCPADQALLESDSLRLLRPPPGVKGPAASPFSFQY